MTGSLGLVFFTSFLVALSGALVPGPLLTITIAQAARRGFVASALLVMGHSLLELLVVVGLWFGLGQFVKARPVLGAMTFLGSAVLLWMGWGMIRSARCGDLDLQNIERPDELRTAVASTSTGSASSLWPHVLTGMAVSVSNPYWVIWWATVGLSFFAALSRSALSIIGAFYLGHITGDIVWYLAIGGAVATGRKLISQEAYRITVQVCAVFLIFLGCSFFYLLVSGRLWAIEMSADWLRS